MFQHSQVKHSLKHTLAITALVGLSVAGFSVYAQSNNPKADQVSYIAQVQAALEASLSMHAQGDAENAKRLIGSASGKRWDRVKADLSAADRTSIEDGIKILNASIDAKESTDRYKPLIEAVDTKLGSLIGTKLEPADAGIALDRMLVDIAFYYGVGVDAGKIVAPRTHALASSMVPESLELAEKGGLGTEVTDLLKALEQRAKAVAPSEEIGSMASQARAAVGKATSTTPTALSNQLFMDRTRDGMKKVDAEYAAGKTDQAVKTCAELYLDGFEYLESAITAKNPELKESIEKQVGGTIPQAIKAGKPASEVSKLIADAMLEVNKAVALLGLN